MKINCKNCSKSFQGKFCNHCGQKASVSELNLKDLIHGSWHSITHTDSGIIRLIKDLFFRPKSVYLNYFSGQRKKYFSPVTFFLITVAILLFFPIISFSQNKTNWIKFNWHGDSIYGKYYDKVAITIPIKVDNLSYNFCGQFDMGATQTVLYGVSLKPFLNKTNGLLQKLDTTQAPYYMNGHKGSFLKNVDLHLDQTLFPKSNLVYLPDFGDPISKDSINTITEKLVGTIAVDLFQQQILVIDFKNNQLCTYTELPKKYAKAVFEKALIRKGRIKLPLKIGDKIYYVMFDTGSCIGDLLLDKETIHEVADSATPKEEFLNGNTWGEQVAYFNKKINRPIYFNTIKLNIQDAQFSDLDRDVLFDKEEKIIGTLGPVLFSNKIVIIDYINNRFGIL